MLEKLDSVNWRRLKHAYGSAGDVPKQIIALASKDSKIREKALSELYGNIFHQGTRYQATPYAIPFLFELINSEQVQGKEDIAYLLVNLALSYEESYLPEGIDTEKFRKELKDLQTNMSPEEREQNKEYGYSYKALNDCYDFVQNGLSDLIPLINEYDKLTKRAIIYALAWFPDLASDSISEIKNILKNFSDEKDIANAILSIGLLNKSSKQKFDINDLEIFLNSQSKLVSISATVAIAENPLSDDIVDRLIEGMISNEEFKNIEDFPFNSGNLTGYISSVLAKYGYSNRDKIIPALCDILKSVNAYQSLDITTAILEIINYNRKIKIKDSKPEELSKLDLTALQAITEYGGWKIDKANFGNYSELMRWQGVPDSKEKLIEYLKL